jgi:phosphoglycolate phosphatase
MSFSFRFNQTEFTASGLAFDKDGTLTDRMALWRGMFEARSALIKEELSEDLAVLWAEMTGVDLSARATVDPFGPLAMGNLNQETIVLAACLYLKLKMPWDACLGTAHSLLVRADGTLGPAQLSKSLLGVPAKLIELKSVGVPLALVTMDSRHNVARAIADLGLQGVFDSIVTADDIREPKPAPQMLVSAARQLGLEPSELLMIGDSRADVLMAQAAGATCVLVGTDPPKDIESSSISAFIKDLTQIEITGALP